MGRSGRDSLRSAVLLSPLMAPAMFAVGLLTVSLAQSVAARDHWPTLREVRGTVGISFVVGVPIAYGVTLLVALPVILWLRHAGRFARGPVLALGAVLGLLTEIIFAPQLRSEMFPIPFPWWSGVGMGTACAAVFWLLAREDATGPRRAVA